MKRLFLGMAVVASAMAFGQKYGIKAGANLSNVSSKGDAMKSKVGLNIGAFVNLPVGGSFSIQPEVIYNSLGTKMKMDYSNDYGDIVPKVENTVALDYVSVPVMAQYHIVPSLVYVEAGPEFGILVNSKLKTEISGGSETINNAIKKQLSKISLKDQFGSFNIGMAIGAGVNITSKLGANVRYVAGLNDITKKNEESNKNNVVQLGLSYAF